MKGSPKAKGGARVSQAELWGKVVPGRRNRDGEEPKRWRKREEASVATAGDQGRGS